MARPTHAVTFDSALNTFAKQIAQHIGASQVLLFGSHARGDAREDSDIDIIVVSRQFRDIPVPRRAMGLRTLLYEVGGHTPMDLICLTPDELERSRGRIGLVAAVLPEAIDLLAVTV